VRQIVFRKPPRRVLLISTPGFGDVLLNTPLLRSIKRAWPSVRIDVMMHEGREAILAGNADIDRCIPIPKRMNVFRFLTTLARVGGRYSLSIAPNGGDRRVFLMRCAARRMLTIVHPDRRSTRWHARIASAVVPRNSGLHTIQEILQFADAIGIERVPEVVAPHAADAEQRVDAVMPFDWRSEPFAVLHVTTNATRKRWTIAGWAAVGAHLEQRGWRCVLTGGPADDPEYLAAVKAALGPRAVDSRGALEMTGVRALLEASRLFAGVDTSTAHLAAAVGVPTLAIFGSGSPTQWAPWPQGYAGSDAPFPDDTGVTRNGNVCVVRGACPCGRDYRNGCGKTRPGRARCLEELDAATVLGAIDQLVGE